ncbi:hypothetical protein DYH55_21180 [Methylovirgula sp. 4M-Z18]|nr:hypothetical protein DYH55_21180 [Methylovirgula sp. 4M-Z18]
MHTLISPELFHRMGDKRLFKALASTGFAICALVAPVLQARSAGGPRYIDKLLAYKASMRSLERPYWTRMQRL